MTEFEKLLATLKRQHGAQPIPPARGPFEHVIWENACYLLPDHRRLAVFESLRDRVGLDPHKIQAAERGLLLDLAKMGGMRPETRRFRWLEIARITIDQFDGDLSQILKWPYDKAKRALKQFPNIGDPGAEKILMFCGVTSGLPLDWNASRVLLRVGYGRANAKNYSAQYRSIQESLAGQLPKRSTALAQAHLLLRHHGKEICRDKRPHCDDCAASAMCAYALNQDSFTKRV
jgi:endonuclease-3